MTALRSSVDYCNYFADCGGKFPESWPGVAAQAWSVHLDNASERPHRTCHDGWPRRPSKIRTSGPWSGGRALL
jgi:hypothetical protein